MNLTTTGFTESYPNSVKSAREEYSNYSIPAPFFPGASSGYFSPVAGKRHSLSISEKRHSSPISEKRHSSPITEKRTSPHGMKSRVQLHIPSLSQARAALQLSSIDGITPQDTPQGTPKGTTKHAHERKRESYESSHTGGSGESMPSPQESTQSPVAMDIPNVDRASQRSLIEEDKTRCRFAEVSRSGGGEG